MSFKKNKSGNILRVVLTFAVATSLIFCKGKSDEKADSEGLRNFTAESFQEGTGWAYRIYENKVAVIEQKTVPGIQGSLGFKTKEEALKTGGLVVQKLTRGIFPPTITKHELDSLGIHY